METRLKLRYLNRGPHHPSSSPSSDGKGAEHTADRPNGLSESARVRSAIDAAKTMIQHHLQEITYWKQEVADLERGNSKT